MCYVWQDEVAKSWALFQKNMHVLFSKYIMAFMDSYEPLQYYNVSFTKGLALK